MALATISYLLFLFIASSAIANQLTPKELFDAVPANCRVVTRVESCEEISTCFTTSTRVSVEGCDDIDITHWPTCIHTTVTHTKSPPKPTFHPTGTPDPPCKECPKPESYCLGDCPEPYPNSTERPGPLITEEPCEASDCKPEPPCAGPYCPEPQLTEKPGPEPTGMPCQGPNCPEPPCAWPGCDPKPPHPTEKPISTSTAEEDCESVFPSTNKLYSFKTGSSLAISSSTSSGLSLSNEQLSSAKTASSYNPVPTWIISPNGNCGGDTGYTCKGSGYGECCGANNQCGNSALYCGNACQPLAGTCPPYTPDGTCGNGCSCLGSPHGECCGPDFKCGSGQFACGSLCKFQWGTCKIMPGK